MFTHILVPLDGSSLAETALPAAASLASIFGSPVTLFHVIEQNAPEAVHEDRHLTRAGEAEDYLKAVAARYFAPGALVDWHVHTAEVRDVAASIAAHAAELRADLIVMCTHGRGGFREALFGSIAQQVIARGRTPVLLLRPGNSAASQPFLLRRILLPLDSASVHDDVFPYARGLAEAYAAEIALLTVIPTFSTLAGEEAATSSLLPGTTSALLDIEEDDARKHLDVHIDELKKAGVTATAATPRGDPASEVVRAGERWGADLIILATHRKAGMDAFWARSVAPNIARRTRVPLLLLPLA
jgi:nucleotide-binding universal stress UspA family protein